ncbi:BirA family transcriptional regulator, biotin operon repressor / biotin-[acetyl-CoA-carboxylase] ligase [Eubacterium ruminantium]|nr:BirA family transcriptional regulator, biotin operon repressor / biotin-[acetyl-CoA-carboxylase] ligase [Eubacterium ruminantium]
MLKDDILRELLENKTNPVSGQYLADKYNVSRNAVWKAINSLKDKGYKILSKQNAGYILGDDNDIISSESIKHFLSAGNKTIPIEVYDVIDSTNNEAKRQIISENIDRKLIVAEQQTSGRGRLGKNFYSPSNTGIYMSLIYKVPGGVKEPMLITMAAAVAVVRAIESFSDIKPGIKWVNDIFIGDKKICGILTEAVTDLETGMAENVVVGIGINYSTQGFPEELKAIAGSLFIEGVSRDQFIAAVIDNLIALYREFKAESFMPEYISHNNVIGKKVRFDAPSGKTEGEVLDINPNGSIKVRDIDGTIYDIFTGEILFRE